MDECTRPSLGRTAKIGDLYDVRTEMLKLSNVFNDNIDEFVEKSSSSVIDSDSFFSTKTSEKLRKLEIDANASLSLLCGTLKAAGSVNFVNNKVCSERAVHCNIVLRKTTKKEHLNYKQLKLREYFELSGHEYATHVIVGITWGANAIITFMDSNKNGKDEGKVKGKLSIELKKLQTVCPSLGDLSVQDKSILYLKKGDDCFLGEVKSNDTTEEWKDAETTLKVYTDIPTGKKLPQTIEEAKEFIDDVSKSEKDGNQQMFHLLPIDSLKSFLQMNMSSSLKFSTISQSRICKIESLFDELDETYGKMHDIVEDINNTCSVPRKEKNVFHKRLQDMAIEIATLKDEIRELVLAVRTTEKNPNVLDEKYIDIQEKSIASRSKFDMFLIENNNIIERAKFLREFEEKGAKTAGNKSRLNEIKRNNINKNIYIFYCSFERDQNSDRINTFCKLINEQKPQDCFIVVEIDSWEGDEIPQTSAAIHLIVDGVLVDSDYNPNFLMEDLENILKITGSYDCDYTNVVIDASCCVEIDNFTKETLFFVGYEQQHGWLIFNTKDNNILPGHRFVFHTQKQKMSLYGVAVMCAWKFQNSLITASWQIPLSSKGGLNSICLGITKPGIKFDEISQTCLEGLLVNKKQGLVDDYYEGGRRSGHFISLKVHSTISESENLEDSDICVSVRMTATSACNLSIQIHPHDVNNYAPELLKHVSV